MNGPRFRARRTGQAVRVGQVLGLAEFESSRFSGTQRGFSSGRDQLRFPLGHGGHDVNGQVVGLRHIDGDESHPRFHERRHDSDVAGEAVELGDQEDATDAPSLFQRRFKLGHVSLESRSQFQ